MIGACQTAAIPAPICAMRPAGYGWNFHANPQIAALGEQMLGADWGRNYPRRLGKNYPNNYPENCPKDRSDPSENPSAGRREIAERLADVTEDGVKYHLDRLKAEGKIRRVGPARGGHWEVLP